jgi:excisionase family DNA binding protein
MSYIEMEEEILNIEETGESIESRNRLYDLYFNLPAHERKTEFVTAAKAGEIVGVTKRTILRWIKIKALNSIYIGNRYYVRTEELKDMLKASMNVGTVPRE